MSSNVQARIRRLIRRMQRGYTLTAGQWRYLRALLALERLESRSKRKPPR